MLPHERNIGLCILLSVITCGIYALYWFYVITNETNYATNHNYDTSGGIALLLSIVTCSIYSYYWAYKQGEKFKEYYQARGSREADDSCVLYLILQILSLGIINYALMQDRLNKMIGTV